MASISSLGLSGLPLSDLLADLRKVEEAPLQLLADRKTSFETKISGYGIIKSSLSSLQGSIKTLGETATFSALRSTSSNTASLTASISTDGGAVAGSYSIEVKNLASTQSLASAGQNSRTEAFSSSDITLTFTIDGKAKNVVVAAADTSLEGIRAAINKAGVGVSATLLNNGGDTNAHQLVFSTTQTGTDASITKIGVTGSTPVADGKDLAEVLAYEKDVEGPVDSDEKPLGVVQTNEAKDADLTLNGIRIVSGSNTVKDAVEGLTLNLLAPTEAGKPLSLKVEENPAVATSAIKAFVTAYNSLNSVIGQLTGYNAEDNVGSALTGDRIPRTVQTQLRSALGSLTGEGGIQMLSQLGITTNIDTGALEIDDAKLTKALADDKGDVSAFFTGDKGFAKKLNTTIDDMLSSDGLIANATEGMKKSVDTVIKQAESMSSRIEDTMARYQSQFVALEVMMSQMNSTSSYLTTQLGMLESMAKGDKK
jgi:flagellar hook-associated protein 2